MNDSKSTGTGYAAIALAGAVGGVASTGIFHPLDLIRARMASQGFWEVSYRGEKYNGLLDAASKIIRHEKFTGVYRGVGASMLGSSVSWAVYLAVYEFLKEKMSAYSNKKNLGPLGNFSAGMMAGCIQATATNPIWLVKTRMQLQQNTPSFRAQGYVYKSFWDGLAQVYKVEGMKGLYRGMIPGYLLASHGGVQFATIEECKKIIQKLHGDPNIRLTSAEFFVASSIGKTLATVMFHPITLVRVRLQDEHNSSALVGKTTYKNLSRSIRVIWTHEGIRGFYKGLVPSLTRAVPQSATALTIADIFLKIGNKVWN